MRGKTVVITGGTSGIGEVAAVALARMGARIVLVARDKVRGDATFTRLRESGPGIAHADGFWPRVPLALSIPLPPPTGALVWILTIFNRPRASER